MTNFEKARDEAAKVIAETHNPRWNTTVHNDLFIDCAKAGANWAKAFMQAEIERLTAELEQLQKAYEERGEAMRHTGDIVRSLYAPKNVKLNKENGKLKGEIQHLKSELAKREGELHMNSDCNVEKLHMNSKGEPAKCELHKNDDVTQNSDINIVSRANPAAIPNGDNGGAKMPPLRRMQFDGHEYVHLQEVLESVDALKAERDRWKAMAEKLAGALEHYKHLAMPKDKISAIVETYPFAAVALAEYEKEVGE